MRIHPVGAKLFPADGRTDRQTDTTKLIVVPSHFVNTLKNAYNFLVCISF